MDLYDLVIEVTRRCNMKCLHCLRGEAENVDIDLSHVEKLFDQIDEISSLTITGGEPSLVPEKISGIIDIAKKKDVRIGRFYLVTNGKLVSDAFMKAVLDLYLYCDDVEGVFHGVDLSNDGYHEEVPVESVKKLSAFRFFGKKQQEDGRCYDDSLISEGEAAWNYGGRDLNVGKICIYPDDGDLIEAVENNIYLNCEGNVLPLCDLSYESQEVPFLILGNVNDEGFDLAEAVRSFNDRFEKEFGSVLSVPLQDVKDLELCREG